MFDCAEASACLSFTIGCFVVREDSSSRNSPTTGRSKKRIAINSGFLWVRFPGGRQEKKCKKGIRIYFENKTKVKNTPKLAFYVYFIL